MSVTNYPENGCARFPVSAPDSVVSSLPCTPRGLGRPTVAPAERDPQARFTIPPGGIDESPLPGCKCADQPIGSPGDAPLSGLSSGIEPSPGRAPRTRTSL